VPGRLGTGLGPAVDVLATLAVAYGPAMLAMGGNAALLQLWYARATGRDPYPLYAVSNAGSMLGLAAYPLFVEPWLALGAQGALWLTGYAVSVAGLAGCALLALKGEGTKGRSPPPPAGHARTDLGMAASGGGGGVLGARAIAGAAAVPGRRGAAVEGPARRLLWVALAAVPSSVLLGATLHITTRIAPLPLLWALPLAVYLATWIAAFARPGAQAHRGAVYLAFAMPLLAMLGVAPGLESALPVLAVAAHLFGLAAVGLLCHGRLAELRPPAERLTGFYLRLSRSAGCWAGPSMPSRRRRCSTGCWSTRWRWPPPAWWRPAPGARRSWPPAPGGWRVGPPRRCQRRCSAASWSWCRDRPAGWGRPPSRWCASGRLPRQAWRP
jgi:hypothetical protein